MKNLKMRYAGAQVGLATALLMMCASAVPSVAQEPNPPAAEQQAPLSQSAQPPENQPSLPNEARGNRGDMADRRVEMLTKQLNLTPDQVTTLKAIDADSRQQMMALRNDTSTTREEKRPKMMAIREAQEAKTKEMLTDEQKPKYEAIQARMREPGRERRDGDPGAPPAPPASPNAPPPQ